jgi:hypothetical protein
LGSIRHDVPPHKVFGLKSDHIVRRFCIVSKATIGWKRSSSLKWE